MPAAGIPGGSSSTGGAGKTGGSVPGLTGLNLGSGAGKGAGPGTSSITGTLPVSGPRITQTPAPTTPGPGGMQPILSPTVPSWATNTNGGFL